MNAQIFDANIRSSYHFLQECKLIRSSTANKSLSPPQKFIDLSLISTTRYRDLYLFGLQNIVYNFLLSDFSYLQFSYSAKQHYRFAYYPNPFTDGGTTLSELDESVKDGVITFEEYSLLLSEQPYEVTKPLIRYEFDSRAYVRLIHPSSHFHIGMHTENRWPVSRSVTPRTFCLLIAKLYYNTEWEQGKLPVESEIFGNRFDRYLANEKADCQLLSKSLFHDFEAAQMHFA